MRFLIGLPVVLLLLVARGAEAVPITLGGEDLEITTITGSFIDNQTLLEAQPWFGDSSLALQAASAVGDAFGTPNISIFGPFFVFSFSPSSAPDVNTATFFAAVSSPQGASVNSADTLVYAVVSEIPLPPALLMLLAGLSVLWRVARRPRPAS
ncbi:MAG: hypothetical protein AAF908_00480 [Pseudomonadota bacterium]